MITTDKELEAIFKICPSEANWIYSMMGTIKISIALLEAYVCATTNNQWAVDDDAQYNPQLLARDLHVELGWDIEKIRRFFKAVEDINNPAFGKISAWVMNGFEF